MKRVVSALSLTTVWVSLSVISHYYHRLNSREQNGRFLFPDLSKPLPITIHQYAQARQFSYFRREGHLKKVD
jgi:hypothetical protein